MENQYKDLFNLKITEMNDYDLFPNKVLLDKIRVLSIQNIIDGNMGAYPDLKDYIKATITNTIVPFHLSNIETSYVYDLIANELIGYGPLTTLLDSDNVDMIMVNAKDNIYVEVQGKLIKETNTSFINDDHIIRIANRLLETSHHVLDENHPLVDVKLSNWRISATMPPLTNHPTMTIRKDRRDLVTMEDLLRNGTLTPYMARFLASAIKAKLNILVGGGLNSGKTMLLNVLANLVPANERLIVCDDALELKLKQPNVVALNANSKESLALALHMAPERLIIDDIKESEAMLLLSSLTSTSALMSIQASDTTNAIEHLYNMGFNSNEHLTKEYVTSKIDLVLEVARLEDGKCKILDIATPHFNNNKLSLKSIFTFKMEGLLPNGEVKGSFNFNNKTELYLKMQNRGINDLDDLFRK